MKLPLETMTVEEKLAIIDEVWESLMQNEASIPSPAWHAEVLAEREAEVASGNATFLTLDEVRERLEKRWK